MKTIKITRESIAQFKEQAEEQSPITFKEFAKSMDFGELVDWVNERLTEQFSEGRIYDICDTIALKSILERVELYNFYAALKRGDYDRVRLQLEVRYFIFSEESMEFHFFTTKDELCEYIGEDWFRREFEEL